MIQVLQCTVNNRPVELGIDPRESLADVLRQRLGLTSVKKGCCRRRAVPAPIRCGALD